MKTKQQENLTPEEAEIKKYGRRGNRLIGLACGGFALAVVSVIAPEYNKPEIAKTYEDVQTSLRTLKDRKINLTSRLYLPYKIPETENFEELFYNKKLDKEISVLDEAIESIETPEFRQYQQNKENKERKFFISYIGGLLAMIGGILGGVYFHSKEFDLKRKYKKLK